ncbi:hypothetical protein CC79DRAFT_772979 [Sarocladium strictum]
MASGLIQDTGPGFPDIRLTTGAEGITTETTSASLPATFTGPEKPTEQTPGTSENKISSTPESSPDGEDNASSANPSSAITQSPPAEKTTDVGGEPEPKPSDGLSAGAKAGIGVGAGLGGLLLLLLSGWFMYKKGRASAKRASTELPAATSTLEPKDTPELGGTPVAELHDNSEPQKKGYGPTKNEHILGRSELP